MSLANLITLARLPLLLILVGLLFVPSFGVRLIGLGLLIVLSEKSTHPFSASSLAIFDR